MHSSFFGILIQSYLPVSCVSGFRFPLFQSYFLTIVATCHLTFYKQIYRQQRESQQISSKDELRANVCESSRFDPLILSLCNPLCSPSATINLIPYCNAFIFSGCKARHVRGDVHPNARARALISCRLTFQLDRIFR